jgi:hypothetical protein
MDPLLIAAAALAGIGALDEKYKEHKAWKQEWRSLKNGMTIAAVKAFIGEPKTIESQAGSTVYHYSLGGLAVFSKNRLAAWKEPAL